jgi:hypothetical protein
MTQPESPSTAEKDAIENALGRRDLSCQCCSAVDDVGLNDLIVEVLHLRAEQKRIAHQICTCVGAHSHHWDCPTIRLGLTHILPPEGGRNDG